MQTPLIRDALDQFDRHWHETPHDQRELGTRYHGDPEILRIASQPDTAADGTTTETVAITFRAFARHLRLGDLRAVVLTFTHHP